MKSIKLTYPSLRRFLPAPLLLALTLLCPLVASSAIITNVSVGDDFFSPKSVSISVSDKVKWTWTGNKQHSSTSDSALWDSSLHGKGFSYTNTFSSAGSFPYHCTIHSGQVGTITVKAVANTPPAVGILSPTNGTVFDAPASFSITASAADTNGSIVGVEFFRGNNSLGTAGTTPYIVNVTNLAAGHYDFSAVATDNGGLKATNSIALVVNSLPTVTIIAPANGATVPAPWTGSVQATASDADGTVVQAQLIADGELKSSLANPSLNFSLSVTNLGAGTHQLTVSATDNLGGIGTSVGITLHVVNSTPPVLSAPIHLSATSFQFSYSATPGLNYVVERSVDLVSWTALSTNLAIASSVTFQDPTVEATAAYYRVGLVPSP
jgi:hypothetical protein